MKYAEMDCARMQQLFSPYIDGRVSGAEMHAVTRHIEKCARCEWEYAAMQRTQQLLSGFRSKESARGPGF